MANLVKLKEVCKVVTGSTPKTSIAEYWNGDIKWITPAELNEDSFYVYDTVKHISQLGKDKSNLSFMPKGTVILSSRAPIGKTAITGSEMCCNQGFKNFVCSEKIFNEYLYFYLKSKTDYLNSLGRGATFKEISKTIVENISIPLPQIDIQKEIASQLKLIISIIDNKQQQLSKLDELVKARFVEMFGDPVSNRMMWDKNPLLEECEIITGNTPPRNESQYYGDYIEWIKSDNINTPNIMLTKASEFLSPEGLEIGRTVDSNCILMTCIAGSLNCIGNVAITDRKVAFNQQINGIVPNKNNVWFMYMQFELSKNYIQSIVTMALKGILSKGQLSKLKFIFPPVELQNEFGELAEQVEKSKKEIQQSLEKLETLKKSLMQEYFG